MRSMTNEEMKKLYESLKEEIEKASKDGAFSVGNWNTSTQPMRTKHAIPPLPPLPNIPPSSPWIGNTSPTDVDGHNQYSYQEPEVDEQGTYYGYKVLVREVDNDCPCPECSMLNSPRYPAKWLNGELEADREPNEKTMFGIHFTKRPDHPNLREYMGDYRIRQGYYQYGGFRGESSVLVKCALSGTIVETEQGFRAQHAMIVGVYFNGNWQSYQDYSERSTAHPRRDSEADYEIKFTKARKGGTWDIYTDWNPNP